MLVALSLLAFAADYDLLIRDARVVDGTGNPWYRADVGIKDGKIAAIGSLTSKSATRTFDAAGKILAPGFIDSHTHVEGGIDQNPRGDNFLRDGVTTVITGNCGSSQLDLGAWFKKLDAAGLGLNVASLVGHNTVRISVMGAGKDVASAEQLVKMEALMEKAMADGAVGFSTGLEYVPGTYVDPSEIIQLARTVARHSGVYSSHMRDEGAKVLEGMNEIIRVGRETQIRVQISHLKQDTKKHWGASEKMIELLEASREAGIDVTVDQYPYTRSSTSLSIRIPAWAQAGGRKAMGERIRAPQTRAQIHKEMLEMLRGRGLTDYSYATIASYAAHKEWEGKTISEVNRLRGGAPNAESEANLVLDILADSDPSMVYHVMSDDDVDRILRYPFTAVASDGGVREMGVGNPHPRSYGTNARVLGTYVRERKVISLEDAIRRMTSLPARTFGFRDRGQVQPGWAADLVLFDPARVKDLSTFAAPHAYSEGFELVLVNGIAVLEQDKLTNQRPGRALRHIE
ncbi:MAG: D-aminoacylase [Bryobacteraceae bacterium]|nr:D-aminoacylase [Bryobacteraceae bacterium]